jgi:glycosyltransferase involved in cell wall biosynthesis
MSEPPLVSVIMIFLNPERFLEEAIASVFAQTCSNWELLLIDDGSSDRSTAIAKGYAERQPERVRYLEHPAHANRGMSASRNLGLAHARGEYIAFLDADDVFLPERLARHVAVLEAQPEVDAVQGRILSWASWQGTETAEEPDTSGPRLPFAPGSVLEPPTLLLTLLDTDGATAPGICNLTVRRHVLARLGGFDDRFRGLYEDWVFASKVYLEVRVGLLADCLALYRQHAESCTQTSRRDGVYRPGRFDPARQAYLRWLEAYLVQREVRDRRVLQALKRQAWAMRHPWMSHLIVLPDALYQGALQGLRATLRLALPGSVYGRLARWRGASKNRRARARVARIARSASREVLDG